MCMGTCGCACVHVCVCMCVHVHVHVCVCLPQPECGGQKTAWKSHLDPGNQIQVFRLSSSHSDPLSHLADQRFTLEIKNMVFIFLLGCSCCQSDRLKNTSKKNEDQRN